MAAPTCNCGHPKRDHTMVQSSRSGSCKICLCDAYKAVAAKVVPPVSVTTE